jgi:hypothetical protein
LKESGAGSIDILLNWDPVFVFCDKNLKKVAMGKNFLEKNAMCLFLNFLKGVQSPEEASSTPHLIS